VSCACLSFCCSVVLSFCRFDAFLLWVSLYGVSESDLSDSPIFPILRLSFVTFACCSFVWVGRAASSCWLPCGGSGLEISPSVEGYGASGSPLSGLLLSVCSVCLFAQSVCLLSSSLVVCLWLFPNKAPSLSLVLSVPPSRSPP